MWIVKKWLREILVVYLSKRKKCFKFNMNKIYNIYKWGMPSPDNFSRRWF